MTIPSMILGLIVALLIGALFHLWRGGGLGRLLLYMLLSIAGFVTGQLLGNWREWTFFAVGPLDLGVATLGSLVFLLLGSRLSLLRAGRVKDENDAL